MGLRMLPAYFLPLAPTNDTEKPVVLKRIETENSGLLNIHPLATLLSLSKSSTIIAGLLGWLTCRPCGPFRISYSPARRPRPYAETRGLKRNSPHIPVLTDSDVLLAIGQLYLHDLPCRLHLLSTTEAALLTLPAREARLPPRRPREAWPEALRRGRSGVCFCAARRDARSAPCLGFFLPEHALTAKSRLWRRLNTLNMILYAPCTNFFHVINTIPEKIQSLFRNAPSGIKREESPKPLWKIIRRGKRTGFPRPMLRLPQAEPQTAESANAERPSATLCRNVGLSGSEANCF